MSVATPLLTLLKGNFRAWISAKGFWLVVAGALLPLVLTGAWVGAHRADMELTDLRIEGLPLEEGKEARFVATVKNIGPIPVGPFNATISLHEPGAQFATALNVTTIDRLEPGQSRDIELKWNATPGVLFVIAQADASDLLIDPDEVGERDEFNNFEVEPLAVAYRPPTTPPSAPPTVSGNNSSTTEVDLVVDSFSITPADAKPGDNVTLTATVRNNGAAITGADVTVRIARPTGTRATVFPHTETIDLGAGETKTITATWTALEGAYYGEAFVVPPDDTKDVDATNNHRAEPIVLNAVVTDEMRPPEPQERLTVKGFYLDVLAGPAIVAGDVIVRPMGYLTLVIPLIAIFYASGVIADERERGSLAYVITRPIPRWLIPLTKFTASFLVAAIASAIGLLITYVFLFGTTVEGGDLGFLTTPMLAMLLSLFAYGALFTLIGTWIERPYMAALGYVAAGIVLALWNVEAIRNASIAFHVGNALSQWRLDEGLQWLPATPEATRAVWVLLGLGVACLALAGYQMRRREFQV